MYVFNNFIIRTRGDQTSLTLRGGLCVDRTVCAELSLAHFSSLIPVPNDVIKFSEGWLSAYHVPSNTRALGTWKHLVGVALFARGPVRVEDERDAQRPHLAVPSALGSAGGQEGAEAETGLGLGTFHGIPPEGQKHRVCPKHLSAHGRSCLTFKSGTEVPFKARRPATPRPAPRPARGLTCMMSMAMACVCTPSTVFTSQCTTSALMKQLGDRPFCSGSSWTPVLSSKEATRRERR